jgi:4-hydroxy 2-oxovalerate aldolase
MTDRRHRVQVLDCSIRDGGCCNEWQFSKELVHRTFQALQASGIEYMEIGYQTSPGVFDRDVVGPWRHCDEDDLRDVADDSGITLSTMTDFGKFTIDDLRPRSESVVGMIRCACYAKDVAETIQLLEAAQDLGYEVMCNVMAVSQCTPHQVDDFLGQLHDSTIPYVALVDSFGAFYPHHIRYLVRKYKNWLRKDQLLGVHLHNNQQTAFANSVVAIEEGADIIDATIHGIGRGAGNCPLELLLMYLDDEDYDVEPILELLPDFAALRDELRFGYHSPYAITGWLNLHPRAAIRQMARPDRYEVLDFYRRMTENRRRTRHHRPVPSTGTPLPAPVRRPPHP